MSEIKGRPVTSVQDMPERGVYLITGQGGWKACRILLQPDRLHIQYFRDVHKARSDLNWDITDRGDWFSRFSSATRCRETEHTGWFPHEINAVFFDDRATPLGSLMLISDEDEGIDL